MNQSFAFSRMWHREGSVDANGQGANDRGRLHKASMTRHLPGFALAFQRLVDEGR